MVAGVSTGNVSKLVQHTPPVQPNNQQSTTPLDALQKKQGPQIQQAPKPTVNTQGQLTGTLVNIKA